MPDQETKRKRIVITTPLELMSKEEQEYWWRKSRTDDVFIEDCNGEYWQVLDLSNPEKENEDTVSMALRLKNPVNIRVDDSPKEQARQENVQEEREQSTAGVRHPADDDEDTRKSPTQAATS